MVIPVQDDNPTRIRPYVTGALIAACAIVFLWQVSAGGNGFERSVFALGVIPSVLFGRFTLPPELDWVPKAAPDSDVRAMIFPSSPTQRLESAGLMFVTALNSARERIWLSAPYFVPDEAVVKALQLAALRGVDVRVITTGKGDSLPVFLAAFHYMYMLRDLGIRFYAYQPGFLHEKVMLVDDEVSTLGTANFDNRSFRLTFEVTALVADRDFAAEMEKMFEADFRHAVPIDPADLEKKSFWWRLGVSLSRLAAPVL